MVSRREIRKFLRTLSQVFTDPEEGTALRGRWREKTGATVLICDVGCGRGESFLWYVETQQEVEENASGIVWIGVDRDPKRIRDAYRTIQQFCQKRSFRGCPEFFLACMDAWDFLTSSFAEGELHEIWVLYPDPQRGDADMRITGARWIQEYARVLEHGGKLWIRTDEPWLWEEVVDTLEQSPWFEVVQTKILPYAEILEILRSESGRRDIWISEYERKQVIEGGKDVREVIALRRQNG